MNFINNTNSKSTPLRPRQVSGSRPSRKRNLRRRSGNRNKGATRRQRERLQANRLRRRRWKNWGKWHAVSDDTEYTESDDSEPNGWTPRPLLNTMQVGEGDAPHVEVNPELVPLGGLNQFKTWLACHWPKGGIDLVLEVGWIGGLLELGSYEWESNLEKLGGISGLRAMGGILVFRELGGLAAWEALGRAACEQSYAHPHRSERLERSEWASNQGWL